MLKQLFTSLMAASLLAACSNAGDKKTEEPAAPAADTAAAAMTAPAAATPDLSAVKLDADKDFVCGMPVKGHTADTAQYKGKVYGFCAKECKDEFVKDPEHYLAQK